MGYARSGKTYFTYALLNELIFKFVRPGKFISLSKSFQELRHTFDEGSATHGQAMSMIDVLSNVPYLVIDDFGVQRNTEWEMEILYNLIDARYAHRRLTFITTNQKMDDIKQLAQGRIYSRILEMCYIRQVTAPDFREMGNPEDKWLPLT
ncbi:MAG: ATP-binding protein [bacterium]|nr:ATP-binding protein [bacterium]